MVKITPMERDTLKFQLENGVPLDRELVAKAIAPYYKNEALPQQSLILIVSEKK